MNSGVGRPRCCISGNPFSLSILPGKQESEERVEPRDWGPFSMALAIRQSRSICYVYTQVGHHSPSIATSTVPVFRLISRREPPFLLFEPLHQSPPNLRIHDPTESESRHNPTHSRRRTPRPILPHQAHSFPQRRSWTVIQIQTPKV